MLCARNWPRAGVTATSHVRLYMCWRETKLITKKINDTESYMLGTTAHEGGEYWGHILTGWGNDI